MIQLFQQIHNGNKGAPVESVESTRADLPKQETPACKGEGVGDNNQRYPDPEGSMWILMAETH